MKNYVIIKTLENIFDAVRISAKRKGIMILLGIQQELYVVRKTDFGVYLSEDSSTESPAVLLPKKQVPPDTQIGSSIRVFIYRDSKDRLISTTNVPYLMLNGLAYLNVKEVSDIGAFVDWGLEKDLFLPFHEQTVPVKEGSSYLMTLYIDKSNRLCASMKIYQFLSPCAIYKKNDLTEAIIYGISSEKGIFAAVDGCYYGLIPKSEIHKQYQVGEKIPVRIVRVRDDGKLDLSPRLPAYQQMDNDSLLIMKIIDSYDGQLPFTDKAPASVIEKEFGLSKNAFKRAVGRLLKEKKIQITKDSIKKL